MGAILRVSPMRGPLVVSLVLLSAVGGTSVAYAGEKEACLAASVEGQQSRAAGKLVEAKEKFLVCAREVCPPIVRQDCSTWNDEVSKVIPTVSIGVKDAQGHDLFDVRVSVDGRVVTEHLDGKSFPIDPGTHVVRAEDGAHAPVEERILVKEGEKARPVNLKFSAPKAQGEPKPGDPAPESPSADAAPGRSPLPFVVLGVGVAATAVGIGLHFKGKGDFPSSCDETTKVCTPGPGVDVAQASKDAESAVNLRNVGTAFAVGGSALIVGGLVWFFLDSPAPKKTARVLPGFGPGYAGLSFSGAF